MITCSLRTIHVFADPVKCSADIVSIMKDNTPPSSPNQSLQDLGDEIDIGDIEEVIELSDEVSDQDDSEEEEGAGGLERVEEDEMEEDIVDMATLTFSKHRGSVFTCSVSPRGDLVATGGEDDQAYVWDITNGNVLFTCAGHKDSVVCVKFNHDGSLLATGDMSGYIQVWKVEGATKTWDFETGDLSWLTWHHASNVLLAGTTEGELWMWLVPKGNARTFPSYGSASQCGALLYDGKRAVSGYEDGSVRVFDLKTGQQIGSLTDGLAHTSPVASIAAHKDNTMTISGSLDGTAILYNTISGKVVGTLNCNTTPTSSDESIEVDHTVEAVGFCPTIPNIAVTATLSGFVTIWDVSTQVSRHVIAQGAGSSHLMWHPSEPIVFTAGLDGVVRSYDVRSGEQLAKYTGHHKGILAFDISKNGSALVTSSDDATARVFKIL
ncbi:angio-associated migratory cell protein isoform X1 [Penaeus vannamei]|uniref:Angio-associated migratory cell protein n=2 Tax=Penaeus vannamei TaxID=6689 RepID=A0A3R7MLI3_PENVA|nr:angio-associated migratory cell protein-like isoform X1 [Penaeus vannamei]ROT84898.1 hypothetical protein C7M84_021912 [Penaeus vannamei]